MESARWAKLPENIAKATPLVIATWSQALCFEMTNGHFSVVQKRILAIHGADKIDPAEMAQNVAAYAVLAWLAAQSPVDFGSGRGLSTT